MPLEGLLELVETLRARIDAHGTALRGSEALTRYALIDPLLRELGWDTSNPDMVVPEYRVPNNQMADYVLLNEGSPAIVVESKKLDEPLQGGKALDQGILYCAHTGSKHFLLTDGRRWEIYESSSTVPRISFDLLSKSTAEVCLKALALWKPSVQAGQIETGHAPILSTSPEAAVSPTPAQTLSSVREPSVYPWPVHSQAVADDIEWHPLPDWKPVQGDAMPVEIMFPDKSCTPINYAYDIVVESARWLVTKDLLTTADCPIKNYNGRKVLVTDDPDRLPGKPADKKKVDGLCIGTQYNGYNHVRNVKRIIEHIDQDPAQFKVRFS